MPSQAIRAAVSRRDFVETALAAAAAALAGLRPGREPRASAAPAAPNDRLRVAVIGVNGQGGAHIGEWLAHPDCDLVAVCDCDPAAYAKHGKRFETLSRPPEYVKDVRRLLERKDIDAVSIATPNHSHALFAVWAMAAGKDVYVEKPCSHNVSEGRIMTEWARRLGRMVQMGVQSRSMTGMRQAVEFVKGGGIGEVKTAHAVCFRRRDSIGLVDTPAPVPAGMDFDLWCGPAPLVVPTRKRLHYDWHWNRVTGNGDLGNQNPHELDKARWVLGKQELPRRVVSLGGRLGYVDNGDVANSQVTIYQWDDCVLISDVRGLPIKPAVDFGLAKGGPFNGACNIWYGSEGYCVGPNYTSGVAFDYDGRELGKWSGGSYQQHFANFVDAIRSREHRDLHLDIEDAHLSSALAHLGNVSWALGERVTLGTRPTLAADHPRVAASLDTFEAYVRENGVDLEKTPLLLGRELAIDPVTERSEDAAVAALFTREYRKGFELPRV
jgi:predicted dehydrogenase